MKNTYEKPRVSKIEVDAQVIRMFTHAGFAEVFWEELQARRHDDPKVSREAVFDVLNEKFHAVFNELRYSSYDSFRQRLNK
jgi:hypothetical protein